MSQELSKLDLRRYLGEKPVTLNRRDLLAIFGAGAAAIALREGALAGAYTKEQVRGFVKQTGPEAKIVIAQGQDLDELDPHYFKGIPSYFAVANVYDNIFAYEYAEQENGSLFPNKDESGGWVLLPWLLESWEVSEDLMTLTFKFKSGLTFSDGTPLTAADVLATWQRGVSDTSVYSKLVFNLMTVMTPEQITSPDDSTIVLTLEKPTVFALKMLAVNVLNIMSDEAIAANKTDADPTAHEYFKANMLGSTAYTLSKWTPGVEWELAPNPNYWNAGALKNGGILNRMVPDASERLALLLNGDVDIAFDLLPKDMVALKDNPDINLYDFTIPWPQFLGFNNAVAPFDNVDVRRAISHAIPYDTIIENVMYGFAKSLKSPVADGMPTSDTTTWAYNGGPAKCAEMLEAAGLAGLTFDLSVRIGFPSHEEIAVWIQSSLMEAGVTCNILKLTDAEYLDKFNSGAMQCFIGEWYSWVNDPIYHLFWNFSSTATGTNGVKYSNPTVDQLITDAMYEPDQEKRNAMSAQAQAIIIDEAPWGLLYQINHVFAGRKNIKGFNWNTDMTARYWLVSKE
jgi:peptide/nickel transport system substrate-binding protein